MTMIGLFTGAPQAAAASSAADDKQGAEGFGSALQDVLSSLAGLSAEASTGDSQDATADAQALVAAPSGVILSAEIPPHDGGVVPAESPAPLAEAVPLLGSQPANSALPPMEPTPLAELVETPLSDPMVSAEAESLPLGAATTRPAATLPDAGGSAPISPESSTPPVETPPTNGEVPAVVMAGSRATEAAPTVPTRRLTGSSSLGATSTDGVASKVAAPTALTGSATPPVESVAALGTASPEGVPAVASSTEAAAGMRAGEVSTSSTGGVSSLAASIDDASAMKNVSAMKDVAMKDLSPTSVANSNRESASTPIPQPAAAPIGTPLPTGTALPVAPTSAPAAPAASAPFAVQLAKPIFSLASAGTGQHIMTVSVTPDNLGPVTVRAHVGAEGVRVELFAPSELGRDAIRAILPELRRDLAGAGLGGSLSLSSQDSPSEQFGAGDGGSPRGDDSRTAGREPGQNSEGAAPESASRRPTLFGTTSTIDVLA